MSAHPVTLGRLLGGWAVDPLLIGALSLAAAAYALGALRLRSRWPVRRSLSFFAGLAVLALALLSGIDAYSEELLSVHAVQHLLLILLAPVLLLAGAPLRLALGASAPSGRRAIARVLRSRAAHALGRPAVGFSLFTAVVLGTQVSAVYEAALRSGPLHAAEHLAYLSCGLLLLAPLLAADPLPRPPGAIARFCWLMAAMGVMAVPAGSLLFGAGVRYPSYLAPARALHVSALSDQHMAGTLMLVVGGALMGGLALALATGAMLAEERRQARRDGYLAQGRAGEPAREPAGA